MMRNFVSKLIRVLFRPFLSAQGTETATFRQGEEHQQDMKEGIHMCEDKTQRTLQFIVRHLQNRNIRFGQSPDAPVFFVPFGLQHGSYLAALAMDGELFRVHVVLGNHVPKEKRSAVAELLVRVNWRLTHGHFEMDFADGEIRYRVTTNLNGIELTDSLLEDAIRRGLWAAERFSPAILSIVWNDASPEDALALAEGAKQA